MPLRLTFIFLLLACALPALARRTVPLTAWEFTASGNPEKNDGWQAAAVPHTWNSKTQTQTHRAAWYRTHFTLTPTDSRKTDSRKEVFVCFDGVGTVADVYLNGVLLGTHRGAYTRFVFDATAAVSPGENTLTVRCDTAPADTVDCLPAGDGFQLYHVPGGLYRPVRLLLTSPVHIDPAHLAASGVFLSPQSVSEQSADLAIKTLVRNDSDRSAVVTVTSRVFDRDSRAVGMVSGSITLAAHLGGSVIVHVPIARPHLWSTTDPYLYKVKTSTLVSGQVTDTVWERTGLRYFAMTPTGFFLNGVNTPLRGVAKHQETEEQGSAVTEADLRRDWEDLTDLGVNFVRLAHYPHAKVEYDLADERGIVVWAENGHSNPAAATSAGRQITREMVLQNFNHPSICFWSVGNEAITKPADIATLEDYAQTVRAEDAARLTTYASSTNFSESPDLDFVAVNRYLGWYGGTIGGFDAHAAFYHYISETGAGGVISVHSSAARPTHKVNKYEPEEYQDEVAESRCQTVFRTLRDQVPLFTWWVFRDFSDPRYKGVNSKGLETFGGFRKDAYSLYQSFLKPSAPTVHLCGKTWFLRRRSSREDTLDIKAYSNAPALTLTVNGSVVGTAYNGGYILANGTATDNVFSWSDALLPGRNSVVVSDGAGHSDSAIIYAETGETDGVIRDLHSSNPDNPAEFIRGPARAEHPFYTDFDGAGDNTFHNLPPILDGAGWIAMKRPALPARQTSLSFTIAPDTAGADLFLMLTAPVADPKSLPIGFTDTGITGVWRDNQLNLVPYALYRRTAAPGEAVSIPAMAQDYVVLVNPSCSYLAPSPKRRG